MKLELGGSDGMGCVPAKGFRIRMTDSSEVIMIARRALSAICGVGRVCVQKPGLELSSRGLGYNGQALLRLAVLSARSRAVSLTLP